MWKSLVAVTIGWAIGLTFASGMSNSGPGPDWIMAIGLLVLAHIVTIASELFFRRRHDSRTGTSK